jgi:hypothetical protein
MVSLEIDGRFPPDADLDQTWHAGLTAFATYSNPPPSTARLIQPTGLARQSHRTQFAIMLNR